nr:DUF421 domain-containing protein [Paenibacillus hamazuiensis]
MLFLLTRILGKKQISQLTFFEYITGITLGELAGFISTDMEAHYMNGVIALLVWFTFPLLMELLTLKSKKLRDLFEGKSTVVIKEGKILENNLKKERYTSDDLLEQLRTKNVFNVADVEFALLEASGDLSVLLKKDRQPVTPADLGLKLDPGKESQAVIMDGKILDEPLSVLGLSREWLQTELEKIGVIRENVFLGQVNSFGELTVDLYDDKIKLPQPQQRKLLLATLKKCEADLALFGLSSKDKEAQKMYEQSSKQLEEVIGKLSAILKQ